MQEELGIFKEASYTLSIKVAPQLLDVLMPKYKVIRELTEK